MSSDSPPTSSSTSVESVASEAVRAVGGKAEGGKAEDDPQGSTEDGASSLDETPTDSTAVANSDDGGAPALDAEAAEATDELNINEDVLELGIEDDDLLAEGEWAEKDQWIYLIFIDRFLRLCNAHLVFRSLLYLNIYPPSPFPSRSSIRGSADFGAREIGEGNFPASRLVFLHLQAGVAVAAQQRGTPEAPG